MSKRSRDKGKRGEKETVELMGSLGFPESVPGDLNPHCFRCKQYRGADVDGPDVLATGHGLRLSVESKLKNKESIKAVLKKAEVDAPDGYLPIVRWRRDREQATIHMPEWVFVKLMSSIGEQHYEGMATAHMEPACDQRDTGRHTNVGTNTNQGENNGA